MRLEIDDPFGEFTLYGYTSLWKMLKDIADNKYCFFQDVIIKRGRNKWLFLCDGKLQNESAKALDGVKGVKIAFVKDIYINEKERLIYVRV